MLTKWYKEKVKDVKENPVNLNRRREDNTMAKEQKANNDLQTMQKINDQVTRTLIKLGVNSGIPLMFTVPSLLVTPFTMMLKDTIIVRNLVGNQYTPMNTINR
jgi:Na+/glutamate symporter